MQKPKIVFFGSSRFSTFVLEELVKSGFSPVLNITSARDELPMEKLREIGADVFVVASFGKILPKELIELPRFKTLNVHPSLLPLSRGPAPIQDTILKDLQPGVTIIRMDEKMDHGPILAQREVKIDPWPDRYAVVEEKLARKGGELLAQILPQWLEGLIEEAPQDDSQASYMNMIKKEDGLLNLEDSPEVNLRKVLAYSTWPGAHFLFKRKHGDEKRVVIKEAQVVDGVFTPLVVIPEGKREMSWESFLKGNA